jgi:hypothetical protein
MTRRMLIAPIVLATACGLSVTHLAAETLSIGGNVAVTIREVRDGVVGDPNVAALSTAEITATDTLAVVNRQLFVDPEDSERVAAAIGGAQLANPRLNQVNPEEFAINITLDSLHPSVHHRASAISAEDRVVSFSSAELGRPNGASTVVTGRFSIDGALAVYAAEDGADLSNARVALRARVMAGPADATPQVVFDGTVTLEGAANGRANGSSSGDLRRLLLIPADIGGNIDRVPVLQLLIIRPATLTYSYNVVVGQPLTLRAEVTVELENSPAGIGATAVIGTPLDSLEEALGLTRGASTAQTMKKMIQEQREHPSDEPHDHGPRIVLFPGLCGALGLEGVVGLLALTMLRATRRPILPRTASNGDRGTP